MATASHGIERRRRAAPPLRTLALVLLALVPLLQVVLLVPVIWTEAGRPHDATLYGIAAERIRAGESPYQPLPAGPHVPGVGEPYLYPPFLAAAVALTGLDTTSMIRALLIVSLLSYWIYAFCLARVASATVTVTGVLIWGAALMAGFGAQGALFAVQIDPLLWALFGLALAFPPARGFGFMAAALVKPYPVWSLGVAAWVERWPVVIGALVAAAAALVVGVLALGPAGLVRESMRWLTDIYPGLSQGQFAFGLPDVPLETTGERIAAFLGNGNLSLGFLPLQLARAAGWSFPGPELPLWARVYLTGIGLAAPAVTIWLTRRRSVELRCAAVMAAATLFGPIFRATYSPILYAVAAAWLGERRRSTSRGGGPHSGAEDQR